MTALHLISSGGYYGVENMLAGLLGSMKRLGCRPVLAVYRNSLNPHLEVEEAARNQGVETTIIPCQGRCDWAAVNRTLRSIRDTGASIVHSHGYKADLYGYLATRIVRRSLVATCHNWTGESAPMRAYERLDRLLLRRFDRIAAVSENVRTHLNGAGVAARKVTVIGNGVDVERLAAAETTLRNELPPGRCIIGSVGRLVAAKGFDILIRCVPDILKRFPQAFLVIAGEGPDRDRLSGIIRELSLEKHVRLVGARDDMPGVYRSLDLFVLPSLNEGMPMVVLEAMAAGLPIVATAVGAIPAMLKAPHAGCVVSPGNGDELAEAISGLLAKPKLASAMGKNAEVLARAAFSIDAVARNYLQMYDGLLLEYAG